MLFYSGEKNAFFHAALHAGAMPADAVKISGARHAQLLAAQSSGKLIAADRRGRPVAVNPPGPTAAQLWDGLRRHRNALLAASDWSQLPDAPPALQAAWRPYRQALRDLPASTRAPAKVVWPEPPAP